MGASSLARRRCSMDGSCSIAMVLCFLSVLIGILKDFKGNSLVCIELFWGGD